MTSQAQTSLMAYRFDNFYLDAANRRLLRDGQPLALNSKYFDVLLLLVSRGGQLVEKASLFEEIWSGVFVTDAALTQCIKDIRKQLGDDAANPRYIKTVPKHGYVFIGEVTALATDEARPATADGQPAQAQPSARPSKFLDSYTEPDAQPFFGREGERRSGRPRIRPHRLFLLHRRPGLGQRSRL